MIITYKSVHFKRLRSIIKKFYIFSALAFFRAVCYTDINIRMRSAPEVLADRKDK